MDLLKLGDNRIKACFLGKWHSSEATCSFLNFIWRCPATWRHRTWCKTHSNWIPTAHELAHQHSKFMTSPVYVRTYVHVQRRSPRNLWRLSTCANSVYQVLFLLSLLRAWEWGYARDSHMVAVYEWSWSHFWNVCQRAESQTICKTSIQLVVSTDWSKIYSWHHPLCVYLLSTWCHCTWRDLPGLHFSKYWRQWRPEKEAKMDSSHTFFFKRSVQLHERQWLPSPVCWLSTTNTFLHLLCG